MKKILIVDDNKNFRLSLYIGLKREGFQVDMAGKAKEAIQKFMDRRYDVMLTDFRMPVINGLELANIATQIDPKMLIILISAYDFKDFEDRFPDLHNYPKLSNARFLSKTTQC